jgi:hypothetical protein
MRRRINNRAMEFVAGMVEWEKVSKRCREYQAIR